MYVDTSYILISPPFKRQNCCLRFLFFIADPPNHFGRVHQRCESGRWEAVDRSLSTEAALRSTSPGWHRTQPCLSAISSTSEPGQVDRSDPGSGPASSVTGSLGLFGNDLREERAADVELRLLCRSAADFHRFRTQLEPVLDWGSAHLEEGGTIRPLIIHRPIHNQRWPLSDSYLG